MVDPAVSDQVVQTVAERSNTDALELPPLFDTLDSDSLDKLIRGMDEGEVSFAYAGYNITVDSQTRIEVDEQLPSGSPVTEAPADDD